MVADHLLPPSPHDPATLHGRGVHETAIAWVADLLDVVDLGSGERVLDLSDGTGVVARAAARLVQPGGTASVVGAKALEGRSARLPHPDASFDAAVSLHTLEAFADRGRVLAELWRVLSPDGRLAIGVWGPIGATRRSPLSPIRSAAAEGSRMLLCTGSCRCRTRTTCARS